MSGYGGMMIEPMMALHDNQSEKKMKWSESHPIISY
jgi:hypothetical protein